jgi:general secretion pathway protein D
MKNKFNWNLNFRASCTYAVLLAMCCNVVIAQTGVTLNLKDADIRSFIETVAEATGRNFVVDPRVKAKVTVISARPMNREEVYQVFLSVLQVHGYAAVQVGEIIKILPDVNAKQGPVITDSGGTKNATGDELVTRVVPIKNVPAAQMVPILRPLVPQQGHLAAYPNSNVLVISDRAANIDRLVSIIDRIDRPDSQEIEVVPLEHASAAEVVRIINSMSRQDAQGQVPGGTTLAADERSNSILLSGDNAARLRIRGLIAHLDTPLQGGGNSQVVFLKYAKASELAPILLGVSQFEAKEGQNGGGAAAAAALQEVDIQADETNNALIITASPAKFDSLRRIISQLDVRRAQVLVEAIIAEVSTNLAKDLGVQFAYLPSGTKAEAAPAVGALFPNGGTNLSALFADDTAGQLAAVTSGFFVGAAKLSGSRRFAALLRALEGDTATNILSTPTLVTLDNEEAEIVVAQNVPFITGQFTNTGAGGGDTAVNPFQTIEREDVGITLRITPQINEGDSVKLDVEQEASTLSTSAVASDLITNKRSIKTSVLAQDQQTIVLGGLIEDSYRDNVQKVPLLGDIPLLGHLFKATTTTKDKQNLMVFIHPVIIRDDATSNYATNAKYSYLRAKQIESKINDRGLIKNGANLLPDLDELVTQVPGGGTVSTTPPVSVDQLLQQSPSAGTIAVEELDEIEVNDLPAETVEEVQTENISIPTESDVIIVE